MSIQDAGPTNMALFEGEQVNDNLLYQAMKLMGFLELSER